MPTPTGPYEPRRHRRPRRRSLRPLILAAIFLAVFLCVFFMDWLLHRGVPSEPAPAAVLCPSAPASSLEMFSTVSAAP